MSSTARFTERETGIVVSVETVFPWEPYPRTSIITYPSGRKYAMPSDELGKFFDVIAPQEIFISAFGGVDDRPTPQQSALTSVQPQQESLADSLGVKDVLQMSAGSD